jgi:hypothetical protein
MIGILDQCMHNQFWERHLKLFGAYRYDETIDTTKIADTFVAGAKEKDNNMVQSILGLKQCHQERLSSC